MILFPGIGGGSMECSHLIQMCSSRLRVISIEYPEWPDIALSKMTFDAFMNILGTTIENSQVRGPVCLAGHSMGGQVAWAVASVLSQASFRVRNVALLDVEADPSASIATGATWSHRFHRTARAIHNFQLMTEAGRLFGSAVVRLDNQALYRAVARLKNHRGQFGKSLNYTLQMRLRARLLRSILRRMQHTSSRLTAPATLFRCVLRAGRDSSATLGWHSYFHDLKVVDIPGDHETLILPGNVEMVFSKLVAEVELHARPPIGAPQVSV